MRNSRRNASIQKKFLFGSPVGTTNSRIVAIMNGIGMAPVKNRAGVIRFSRTGVSRM